MMAPKIKFKIFDVVVKNLEQMVIVWVTIFDKSVASTNNNKKCTYNKQYLLMAINES